ncbi:TRAP transporter substrate-binding protein DctP [Hirschia litorea]|uniref:TRAP transporter substrate-binding protein DctP n=1 Tax=Hirschia litorea TaxID=1199156 RepID=A0ABW2INI9_9PROT
MTGTQKRQECLFWVYVAVFIAVIIWLGSLIFSKKQNDVEILRFAHVYEVAHPLHEGALKVAEDVAAQSGGRVQIQVFPASSLGKETALNEALTLGIVDIIYTGTGFAGSSYGPISMTDFPYTLRNLDHWRSYKNSDLFQELSEGYKSATHGNEVAAISYFGTRQMLADRPILTPQDMKNMKIRVPNAPAYVMFPKVVGANPAPIAFSEAYLALQQGVVDGLESPLQVFQAKRFFEVRDHISLTSHIINSTLTIASGKRLEELGEVDRDIVRKNLLSSADWVTEQVELTELEMVNWFKDQGISIHEVDTKPFRDAVLPELSKPGMPFPSDIFARLQAVPDFEIGGEANE